MEPYSVVPPGDGVLEQHEPLLARDSFRYAKQRRAQCVQESPLVLTNCRLLDTRTGQCSSYGHSMVIRHGRIEAIDSQLPPQGAVVINCSGLVLMPGLCDAHVHVTATTANLAGLYSLPESLVTARAADILESMISRGYTTVRDAGEQRRMQHTQRRCHARCSNVKTPSCSICSTSGCKFNRHRRMPGLDQRRAAPSCCFGQLGSLDGVCRCMRCVAV
eukprot:GHRQ01038631.1.p1 GENE.GHRQ01038631.1~~GHRQ01038631.1.p1  ORF type:complete len:218 (+),score=31.23 GHRQ01038631.1:339-992(+)